MIVLAPNSPTIFIMNEFLKSNNPVTYWAYPGIAETEVLIQTAQNPALPTANRVIEACLEHFEVTQEEFESRSRLQKIVRVRRSAGFILFHFCGWSFVKVAKFLDRDRTNMMHHVRQLEARMSVYKEERDQIYKLLCDLELINTSSSGSDWFYSWSHEQLKQPETYMNVIKKDAGDALKEIIAINHADGRKDKDPKNKLLRNQFLTGQNNRMTTVGTYHKLTKLVDDKKKDIDAYSAKVSEAFKRREKFAPKVVNEYDKY